MCKPWDLIGVMGGRPVEYPIHPDDGHLPEADRLRRRLLFTHPENRGPDRVQVAQKGEFRYTGRKICQYCRPIVQTGRDTGSKMIANGCFWMEERPRGRPIQPIGSRAGRNRLFRISFPARMIRDPNHRIYEAMDVRHDPPGYRLRWRAPWMIPENRGPDRMQVAQKGEFRYTGRKICQYCRPIVQIERDTGSKMIANGRFPAGDRLSGRPTVSELKEWAVLGSHFRPG